MYDQVSKMNRVNSWAVLSYGFLVCRAQEEMDQMEDPVDLESLTEDSKRLYQHLRNAEAFRVEPHIKHPGGLAL